jgi:hypothetical protein
MTRTPLRAGMAAGLLALFATGFSVPAQAATAWAYVSTAGGTYVQALDSNISSQLTAQSGITGGPVGQKSTNSTATVNVAGLVNAGVITTSATSTAIAGGANQLVSTAKTAGVNLLGGLITADAIETTSTLTANADGTSTTDGGTKFVNLKIAGVNLPVNIPRNYFVEIPGIAQIGINGFISGTADGGRASQAWGLGIVLLQGQGGAKPGAAVYVNPTFQSVVPVPPAQGADIAGNAFGTWVQAAAGSTVGVNSGPTAMIQTPYAGSDGKPLTNSTASVNVPGILSTGVITSTTTSTKKIGTLDAEITNSNQLGKVNVLGGVITADAVGVTAHGKRVSGAYTGDMKMTLVNLKVAGIVIPLDVKPNTTINVAGLGKVVINQQIQNGGWNIIRGVYVELSTAQAGLPVGATIEIAVAATRIL